MADDRERIIDLLLERTKEGKVAWTYREAVAVNLERGPLDVGSSNTWRAETYTAQIKTEMGELFVILRAYFKRPLLTVEDLVPSKPWRKERPEAAEGFDLTIRDVTGGTEVTIASEGKDVREKLYALWNLIRPVDSTASIIKVLERA
jgi:hypothetical protein